MHYAGMRLIACLRLPTKNGDLPVCSSSHSDPPPDGGWLQNDRPLKSPIKLQTTQEWVSKGLSPLRAPDLDFHLQLDRTSQRLIAAFLPGRRSIIIARGHHTSIMLELSERNQEGSHLRKSTGNSCVGYSVP
jgi:hypothetical protein